MDHANIQADPVAQAIDACHGGDTHKLIQALQNISFGSTHEFVERLRALELQLRLVEFYLAGKDKVLELPKSMPLTIEQSNTANTELLERFHKQLNTFVEQFGNDLEGCINEAAKPSLSPTALTAKLENQTQARIIMERLIGPSYHDSAWLIERSAMTKASVQDSLWSIAMEIEQSIAQMAASNELELDDEAIASGFKVAAHELDTAINGLRLAGQKAGV